MSVSAHVHAGPYLACMRPEKKIVQQRYSCINQSCSQFERLRDRKDKFCSECGLRLVIWPEENEGAPSLAWDATTNVKEVLYAPGINHGGLGTTHDFFVANRRTEGIHSEAVRYDGTAKVFSFDAATIEREKQIFRDVYAKEIKLLEDLYGKGRVSLEWGVLLWED